MSVAMVNFLNNPSCSIMAFKVALSSPGLLTILMVDVDARAM